MDPDLDLRKVRYFVAVAERLHFGQAASALHITQPALSRQIQQLERDLGVELFARSSREVALTPAGEAFFRSGRQLLAAGRTALEGARRAAAGDHTLRVGFMLAMDTEAVLAAFGARHPGVSVLLQRLRWWKHAELILDGSVDAGFVRLPIAGEGLELLPLYTEPVSVALPAYHPHASRSEVGIADIADEPVLHYADAIAAWNAFWCVDPRPDGTQARRGPVVHDMEEIVEYVRTGRGVAFLPAVVCAMFPRPGIAYVPVTDIPPGQVALAWAAGRRTPLVDGLAEAAQQTVGDGRA
ncbi:MAG TPA: LysR substrate-binding domain-containing protein [Actinocrinis sp.]|uniref:LysR family transcriptional regulator n=1 Tax=Actinocrinis sp. TaxID=1920516 RepID=UPI002DDCD544|nr:LysR substrate-binding domain-containing protein [Actinocrinis sp.]HEV3169571.1 LysR substrate-binding domain-containing protein [Actinocrinis sp.]